MYFAVIHIYFLLLQDDLGRLVYQICEKVPHGVLCFFSSYAMMESQLNRWGEIGLLNKLEKTKVVLREPRRAKDLDQVMDEYRTAIRETAHGPDANGCNGALLFAVFRGKVAEGIDFSDNEARCVMTVSLLNLKFDRYFYVIFFFFLRLGSRMQCNPIL